MSTGQDQLKELLQQNRQWVKRVSPDLLASLEKGQSPKCLWIGCSDSRVSPTTITNQPLGSLFEHRNIANVISSTDGNAMAVVEFSISLLGVPDIVVCGHTECTGVATAMIHEEGQEDPSKDHLHQWLVPTRKVYQENAKALEALDPRQRVLELGRLNVAASVSAIAATPAAKAAWANGQPLRIHGWRFNMAQGLLEDLNMTHDGSC
ncbi:carbonate dehydratase [Piptocephalis cylindrospora]|uniref:Carbonic anhydrase n=1 Tax=Piptocephalis cylindrospora TaxID=1907219 RepID=A0A4P9Y6D7_9FUNG|nr:carbonate dehydratase [Piptocephalis cylindrospora]|eukprot:RKP14565.1 carbonate dehydratase [Piptocephalis cylindrospora]